MIFTKAPVLLLGAHFHAHSAVVRSLEHQDTETFLVLCSPAILTRKWCVGEMVTARANEVSTLLLTWPGFALPDETGQAMKPA